MDTDGLPEMAMMQLSDSAFPAGLFAASNGLEGMFMEKKITTAAELAEFGRACLVQQLGPGDCVILANVIDYSKSRNYAGIAEADAVCTAIRTVKESRDASRMSGVQLARCVGGFCDDEVLGWYLGQIEGGAVSGTYPVSLGICSNALGIEKDRAVIMLLYGFVAGTVGAALRLGIIQHMEGQRIIHDLKPVMGRVAQESAGRGIDEVWQFLPQVEIGQMRHEKLDSRMFIT